MKRLLSILILLLYLAVTDARANVGHPFFVNFRPAAYNAHNRNFDVICDDKGRVYVANFEGLLYYDHAEWHVIHAPGIFRITRLYLDTKGRIWVGGYNVLGYLTSGKNGNMELKTVFSRDNKGFIGEVTGISEKNGKICIETSIGTAGIEDHSMDNYIIMKTPSVTTATYKGVKINDKTTLDDGSLVMATAGGGLVVTDASGNETYHLTERNGLCDDNINAVYCDRYGNVWGATDNGVFVADVKTAYTSFQATDGLFGEVLSINHTAGSLYVGTLRGLFVKRNNTFERVGNISNACWNISNDSNGRLIASTAEGVFLIENGKARQLTKKHTVQTISNGDGTYYAGEVDGVFLIADPKRNINKNAFGQNTDNGGGLSRKINTIEKATHFFKSSDGSLWIRNIYGQVFRCTGDYRKLNEVLPEGETTKEGRYNYTIIERDGEIIINGRTGSFTWDNTSKKMVRNNSNDKWDNSRKYPQLVFPYADEIWSTDNEGKNLQVHSWNGDYKKTNSLLRPVHDMNVRAMDINGGNVWMGGNFGLICWNSAYKDADLNHKAAVYIRRIVMDNDSVLWGGFSNGDRLDTKMPFSSLDFDSDVNSITIHFSTDITSTIGDTEYSYRLGSHQPWSEWTKETMVKLSNPRSGNYTFEVRARDRYGTTTKPVSLNLIVHYPIYLRWYFILLYVMLLAIITYAVVRWRMSRLLKEKLRLETIVEERTSQIRQQKDEIEEKSNSLEKALDELNAAQYQLLRQERMATVGKLTQGLVDRILNPMNYVNNFSHMSLGLIKDITENLEDDEEKMTPDNYEDCMDIVDMLKTNLTKIEEHGINTTRILKAMEEMLKDRKCNFVETDVAAVCRKNIEMTQQYFADNIRECGIAVETQGLDDNIMAMVDADQISRVIMSIIGNGVYAVCKKYKQKPYQPTMRLSLSTSSDGNNAIIAIYDNGIGIEKTIIGKVFDPFFTTKTTAEAVGVGLYLSREIILNHGGDIKIESTKEVETTFTITLPIKKS